MRRLCIRAAYPQATSGTTTLQLLMTLPFPGLASAADIWPDGNEIILRSDPSNTGRLFTRPAGGSIADAFNACHHYSAGFRTKGEAIGFDPNGRGYFTTSERTAKAAFNRFTISIVSPRLPAKCIGTTMASRPGVMLPPARGWGALALGIQRQRNGTPVVRRCLGAMVMTLSFGALRALLRLPPGSK